MKVSVKNKLIYLIVITVSIILGFVFGNLLQSKSQITNLSGKEYYNTGQAKGYLYEIKNLITDNSYYISVDELLSKYNKSVFEVNLLSEKNLWDPKSCSKMPTTILTNGNIYMLEVVFKDGEFFKKLVYFNFENKNILEFSLKNIDLIGGIYSQDSNVFFFSKANNNLYVNVFTDTKSHQLNLDSKLLIKHKKGEEFFIEKDLQNNVLIKKVTNFSKTDYYKYINESKRLEYIKNYQPTQDFEVGRELSQSIKIFSPPDTVKVYFEENGVKYDLQNEASVYVIGNLEK